MRLGSCKLFDVDGDKMVGWCGNGSKVKKSKRRKVEGGMGGVGDLLVLNGSESRSGPE